MSILKIQSFFLRGGVMLAGSAVLSKILGIWRDRLFTQIFGQGESLDAVITAFRIPDFFFFLLISGTLSTILIPRMKNEQQSIHLVSSFLWRLMLGFGMICIFGIIFAPWFAQTIGKGLSIEAQENVAYIARYIFGSVFILSIASCLSTYLQKHEHFFFLALSPLLYTLVICIGTYTFAPEYGFTALGLSVISGALIYLCTTIIGFVINHGQIMLTWKPPNIEWSNIGKDFFLRVGNNSAFQINQTVDIFIAGFIAAGAVGAFNYGTNLGNVLLSIVGLPIANSMFPRLTKDTTRAQKKEHTFTSLKWVWIFCIPVSVVGIYFATPLVSLVYTLSGTTALMAGTVFAWTIASLPATCSIPTLSRYFLAQEDTKTPLYITIISLGIATMMASILVFYVLPDGSKILGLALGNFIASTLSFLLFFITMIRQPCDTK